jgi:hypothetical protein
MGVSAFDVALMLRVPPLSTSHTQPLPNTPAAAALNSSVKRWCPPKSASICAANAPRGLPCGSFGLSERQ